MVKINLDYKSKLEKAEYMRKEIGNTSSPNVVSIWVTREEWDALSEGEQQALSRIRSPQQTPWTIIYDAPAEDLGMLSDNQQNAIVLTLPHEGKGLSLRKAEKRLNITYESVRQRRDSALEELKRLQEKRPARHIGHIGDGPQKH